MRRREDAPGCLPTSSRPPTKENDKLPARARRPVRGPGRDRGGRRRALSIEHQLRPLFGLLSALVPPTGVYASEEDFTDGALTDPVTLARIGQLAGEIAAFASPRLRLRVDPAKLGRVA